MLRTVWATALEVDALEGDALLEAERMILEDPALLDEARLKFTIRALEQDNAATRAWIDAQSERTEHALAALRDPQAEERMQQLLSIASGKRRPTCQ